MPKRKKSPDFLDIWTFVYLAITFLLTLSPISHSMVASGFLCLLTLPFYKHEDRLLDVCLVVSSISYYYANGDEQPISIYSMLCLFCLLRGITGSAKRTAARNGALRTKLKNLFPRLLLIVVLTISYSHSTMSSFSGFMELVYVVLVSIVVSIYPPINEKQPLATVSFAVCINIIFLALMLAVNHISNGSRMQFSPDVNPNSFGFSSSFMSALLTMSLIIYPKRPYRVVKIVICVVGIVLMLLSGSRNALLAYVAAVSLLFLLKYKFASIKKFIPYALVAVVIVVLVMPLFHLDSSRFSVSSVVESGGSSRTLIWGSVIPYVWENCFMWGYGPGKAGSTEVLLDLVRREYNSTHNTLVESFAETGIIGLSVFLILFVVAFVLCVKLYKRNKQNSYLLCLFAFLFFSGIGECFYNDIVQWLLIGLASRQYVKRKLRPKNAKQNMKIQV